jgi:hypothetical protein
MPDHPYLQWPVFRRSVVAAFQRSLTLLGAGWLYQLPEAAVPAGVAALLFDVLSIDGEDLSSCRCSSASAGCCASCRRLKRGCCISITSSTAAAICFVRRASVI